MKVKLLYALLALGLAVTAQESKFSYGINVFPNYSIGVPVTSTTAPNMATSIALNSYEKFSLSSSVFFEYSATEKIHISVGLGYFNNGIFQKWDNLLFEYPDATTPESYQILYNHHSIELLIQIKKYFGKYFYGTTGISPTYTFSNTFSTKNVLADESLATTEKVKDTSAPYRTINLYANLGFGVDYISNDKIALYIQPYAQYGFLGIAKDVPMNYIMFSFGLSTGIRFNK